MTVSKTVCGIILVLLSFRIIGKTIKTLGFQNNTHLLDLCHPEAFSEPCQTFKMEHFAKMGNDF